jgi:hypothetical protein
MTSFEIREAVPRDARELAVLRNCLWPDGSIERHLEELTLLLSGRAPGTLPVAVLVAQSEAGIVGFAEVGLR